MVCRVTMLAAWLAAPAAFAQVAAPKTGAKEAGQGKVAVGAAAGACLEARGYSVR